MEQIHAYIVEQRGAYRVIADIDRNREHWRDSDGFIATILDCVANEVFADFAKTLGWKFETAAEFRNRHLA